VTKKMNIIAAILIVLLYAFLALYKTYIAEMGEIFAYLLLAIIVSGIVAAIWLYIKPPKKNELVTSCMHSISQLGLVQPIISW
jgi:hypothetical protein